MLERGFALVTDGTGTPVKRAAEAAEGAMVNLRFADADRVAKLDPDALASAHVNPAPKNPKAMSETLAKKKPDAKKKSQAKKKPDDSNQDQLF